MPKRKRSTVRRPRRRLRRARDLVRGRAARILRKRSFRKRKFVRRKKTFRNFGKPSKFLALGYVPDVLFRTFKWDQSYNIEVADSGYLKNLRCMSPYDPDWSLGGHSVQGWHVAAGLYNRYRTIWTKIEITFTTGRSVSSTTSSEQYGFVGCYFSPHEVSNIPVNNEIRQVKDVIYGYFDGARSARPRGTCSAVIKYQRWYPDIIPKTDAQMTSEIDNNPVKDIIAHIFVKLLGPVNGASTVFGNLRIRLIYRVKLVDPKIVLPGTVYDTTGPGSSETWTTRPPDVILPDPTYTTICNQPTITEYEVPVDPCPTPP